MQTRLPGFSIDDGTMASDLAGQSRENTPFNGMTALHAIGNDLIADLMLVDLILTHVVLAKTLASESFIRIAFNNALHHPERKRIGAGSMPKPHFHASSHAENVSHNGNL